MEKYNQYIERLKNHQDKVDYQAMHNRIENKLSKKRFSRLTFATAGALALVAVVALFYISPSSDEGLLDYLSQQEEINGNPIIAYVFE
jgi:hypothetical protein